MAKMKVQTSMLGGKRVGHFVDLDVTDWECEDVTEGRVAFRIDSVSDGTTEGAVNNAHDVDINGKSPTDGGG